MPRPQSSTPQLFDTTCRSVVPASCSAAISWVGDAAEAEPADGQRGAVGDVGDRLGGGLGDLVGGPQRGRGVLGGGVGRHVGDSNEPVRRVRQEQMFWSAERTSSVSVGDGVPVEPVTCTATTSGESAADDRPAACDPSEMSSLTVEPVIAAPRVRPDSSYAGSCRTSVVV